MAPVCQCYSHDKCKWHKMAIGKIKYEVVLRLAAFSLRGLNNDPILNLVN